MLPGKKLTPEDIARILARRAWLITACLIVVSAAAYGISKRLPNQYRSETLIMLMPQRVPDSVVRSTVTMPIEDRLATLEQEILSRSRLERIILDLNLYPALRQRLPMEVVVQRMRGDITVKTEGKESFRLSYIHQNALTAQRTTERIASLFIQENLRDRENIAEDTSRFLDSQLEDAKRRLVEHEKMLEEYRLQYADELPERETANLQTIQNAQMQLQTLGEATARARERRLLLERQMADLQTVIDAEPAVVGGAAAGAGDAGQGGESTAQQLQAAQAKLEVLLSHDKPDHPDVRAMRRTIRDLEARLEAEKKHPPVAAPRRFQTPAEAAREKRLVDLRAQMDELDVELKGKEEEERHLRVVIAEYQAKVAAEPKHESRLVELKRDYATLQNTYATLLAKREDSKIAANLERKNIGEQYKILDPAKVPERPFSPNRLLIDVGGASAGLALGLLLTAFLEYRDTSFKREDEVVLLLSLPVLGIIPRVTTTLEQRRMRRRRVAAVSLGVSALVLSAIVVLWRLQS